MIQALGVWNIAILERAELELGRGLNLPTGETGTGESVGEAALRHARDLLGSRSRET